jgi:hypothetical protein
MRRSRSVPQRHEIDRASTENQPRRPHAAQRAPEPLAERIARRRRDARGSARALLGPFALLVATACASVPSPPNAPTIRASDFRIPAKLGSFELKGTHDYTPAGLGFSARYVSDEYLGLWADVYVYPVDPVPEGLSLRDLLTAHFVSVEREIHQVMSQSLQQLELAREEELRGGSTHPLTGLWASFDARNRGESVRSLLFLGIRNRLLVKLRATYTSSEQPEWEAALRLLIADFAAAALGESAGAAPKYSIAIGVPEGVTPENCVELIAWKLGYARAIERWIAEDDFVDSFARELEARRASLEAWQSEIEKQGPSPDSKCAVATDGMRAQQLVDRAGFLPEYVWQRYRKAWWTASADLRLDAYEGWAQAELPAHDAMEDPAVIVSFDDAQSEP